MVLTINVHRAVAQIIKSVMRNTAPLRQTQSNLPASRFLALVDSNLLFAALKQEPLREKKKTDQTPMLRAIDVAASKMS
jgi:hypothetical protein